MLPCRREALKMMVFSKVDKGRVDSGTGEREEAAADLWFALILSPRAMTSLHLRPRRALSAGVDAFLAACMYKSAAAMAWRRASSPQVWARRRSCS